ncbi:outer membrane protein (associated with virulence) [Salmonella enterica subsp. enterica]|uniref:Outer membrane protein (Associated with virulence) n=1 Tax=Salmonella enterica I TaxID=59201 RepID=A0A379UUH8_SALET|nr:outer membrane protein (associated with virulence) [Salmonella enterica subsp. enterica]SUH32112.1 outer membrane protein (associated with virulence) [Salmonella enterica subsp. enterica]VFS33620.1 outer membrane protein (associated with virulence) [Salmonella enterica subsp. enterica serovar Typhimurium]
MNKMLLAGSTGIVLLSAAASPVWADDNASTFSLGYAQSHTNHAGTLRGVRLANNYEMSPDWGADNLICMAKWKPALFR